MAPLARLIAPILARVVRVLVAKPANLNKSNASEHLAPRWPPVRWILASRSVVADFSNVKSLNKVKPTALTPVRAVHALLDNHAN